MNFKIKCYVQRFFSAIPNGQNLNYLFQKHITKTFPVTDAKFLFKANTAYKHHENYEKLNKIKKPNKNYYEFGAGWDLILPLAICQLGYKTEVVDIRKLLIYELVNDANNRFNSLSTQLPFNNSTKTEVVKNLEDLKEHFGLEYHAPKDARDTGFPDNHFDFSSSTSTMEHIPPDDILKILNETYRIIQKGGVLSMSIDYIDHWSYFDSSLSLYNFLQYSPSEWKKFNPDLNYQNRLRHSDYLEIIAQTQFEVVLNNPRIPNEDQRKALKNMKLDDIYKGYSYDDLEITGSEIVLRK